jgi:Calcium-dependent channel, 7TM region, putative phosphate
VRRCGGKCCVTTARDEAAFMAPASIRYGREIGVMMLVFIVGWAYCLVSPILIVISAIYFMSSWVVWRWQIIYVYVRCYEGGGEIWRSIVACLFFSMLIFSFFISCVFVAKQAFYQAAVAFVVLPIIIMCFWCAPATWLLICASALSMPRPPVPVHGLARFVCLRATSLIKLSVLRGHA